MSNGAAPIRYASNLSVPPAPFAAVRNNDLGITSKTPKSKKFSTEDWPDKILNEPRLGFVKEHGSKRRPKGRKGWTYQG